MSEMSRLAQFSGALLLIVGGRAALGSPPQTASPSPATRERITRLYDAFGKPGPMRKDWGYAALVEYGGKRIRFDTGNNPDILAQNAKTKRVDLSKLDFIVMSHRHGDHLGGLRLIVR
jgi:7,8-dihydropterin-6-yl-methyl-4-(beta-D-ribofuranosyl)aminobenzene 5'-phosphate synthase